LQITTDKVIAIAAISAVASSAITASLFLVASQSIPVKTGPGSASLSGIAASAGTVHRILLIAAEKTAQVAPDNGLYPGGLWYNEMVFNGTVPGPLIESNQGDTIQITLKNEGKLVHSLNFHAGFGPSQALSGVVNPGQNRTWSVTTKYPGAYLYHCDGDNLNGIWEHIADGMYGGIVVHSSKWRSSHEFYVAFSELYDTAGHPPLSGNQTASATNASGNSAGDFDIGKFVSRKPDLVLTNGLAFRYIPQIGETAKITLNSNAEVFHVKAGEPTRWFLFNAGPRNGIAFNFGAGLIREEVPTATEDNSSGIAASNGSQITSDGTRGYSSVSYLPPGAGAVFDTVFPEPGVYFGNDHDVGSILYGAGFEVIAS
jgi:nitrite reductase (NO-forming)